MHIYLADHAVAERLLALASWRAALTAKKVQLLILAVNVNHVRTW